MKSSTSFVSPPSFKIIIDLCPPMLIPLTLNKCNPTIVDAPAVIDTTVFAGKETSSPIQVRDRTPYISLVLIGGVFFDATTATTLQSQPVEYLTTIKDREDNAPSP